LQIVTYISIKTAVYQANLINISVVTILSESWNCRWFSIFLPTVDLSPPAPDITLNNSTFEWMLLVTVVKFN